jgi:serine/threonine protein phosphatase 1
MQTTDTRIYVIADIHGRADLLQKLLKAIEKDAREHDASRRILVTLGDYIDRGPESRKVIETLVHLPLSNFTAKHLCGNHEDMFLAFLEDPEEGLLWISNGGWSTLLSYGFSVAELPDTMDDLPRVRDQILQRMPKSHLGFLRALKFSYHLNGYFFVHAGVRPGVALDAQDEEDLLWIREEFLFSNKDFSKIVVHGHSMVSKPEIHKNRIALDTGAFHTGKLTCLVLNGKNRYFLQATQQSHAVSKIAA